MYRHCWEYEALYTRNRFFPCQCHDYTGVAEGASHLWQKRRDRASLLFPRKGQYDKKQYCKQRQFFARMNNGYFLAAFK
jgi:hypothetical protein